MHVYYSVDDVKAGWPTSSPHSSLVAGTMCSPLTERTNGNELNRRSMQNNVAQQENVPQQRGQRNIETSLRAVNFDEKITTPANEQPPLNNLQQQGMDHLPEPSNAAASGVSDVSKSTYKSAQSKQQQSSTISTGKNTFVYVFLKCFRVVLYLRIQLCGTLINLF